MTYFDRLKAAAARNIESLRGSKPPSPQNPLGETSLMHSVKQPAQHNEMLPNSGVSKESFTIVSPNDSLGVSLETRMEQILKRLGYSYNYIVDLAEAKEILPKLKKERLLGIDLETKPKPGLDRLETAALSPCTGEIRLIQLATADHVYVFDVDYLGVELFSFLSSVPIIAHHAYFEAGFLLASGIDPGRIACTQQVDVLLKGGMHDHGTSRGRSLKNVCFEYLRVEIPEESKNTLRKDPWVGELSSERIIYAALDAALVYCLWQHLWKQIKESDRETVFLIASRVIVPVVSMELEGVPLDVEGLQRYLLEKKAQHDQLQSELLQFTELENLSKKEPLAKFWKSYCDEHILSYKLNEDGSISLSKDSLGMHRSTDPNIKKYLQYKELETLLNNKSESFFDAVSTVTGRLHGTFKPFKARTGRWSCSDPSLQTVASEIREFVKPNIGRVLVVADYSQIELRLAAIIAQEEKMLDAYRKGDDLHRLTASAVFKIPPEQVTTEQRKIAKAINFGFIYGQSANGFKKRFESEGGSITESEAKAYREGFFKTYPAFVCWHETCQKQLLRTGTVKTWNGWCRNIRGELLEKVEKLRKKETSNLEKITKKETALDKDRELLLAYLDKNKFKPTKTLESRVEAKKTKISRLEKEIKTLLHENSVLKEHIFLCEISADAFILRKRLREVPKEIGGGKWFNIEFESYNTPVQGTGAELISSAIRKVYDNLKQTKGKLINCVHDEIVVECEESEVELVKGIVKIAMQEAFSEMFPNFNYMLKDIVEVSSGKNWQEAK